MNIPEPKFRLGDEVEFFIEKDGEDFVTGSQFTVGQVLYDYLEEVWFYVSPTAYGGNGLIPEKRLRKL